MFQNLIDIIASPTAAFVSIKQKPTILFPLLLVVLSTVSIQTGYFLIADPGFIVDQLVEQAMASNPGAPEGQIREAYAGISPTTLAVSAGGATFVLLLLILSLNAWYLSFMSKFSFNQLGWRSWMALVCWTSVPTIFVAIAAWASMLSIPNGLITLNDINPLSLQALLQPETPNTMLQSMTVVQFWTMALLVLGYRNWTGKTTVASAVIVLAPYVLIYGIWALVTLL